MLLVECGFGKHTYAAFENVVANRPDDSSQLRFFVWIIAMRTTRDVPVSGRHAGMAQIPTTRSGTVPTQPDMIWPVAAWSGPDSAGRMK